MTSVSYKYSDTVCHFVDLDIPPVVRIRRQEDIGDVGYLVPQSTRDAPESVARYSRTGASFRKVG